MKNLQRTKKTKIIALVCCICLLLNITSIIFNNMVYAINNYTLDFNDEHASINEGVAIFNINDHDVEMKLVTKDNDTNQYTDVSITDNMTIDLDEKDYYLYINNNGQNISLEINGSGKQMPGDNCFGLHPEDFANTNVLVIDLQAGNSQNNNSGGTQNQGQEGPSFEVVAYFEGVNRPVVSDEEGSILLPDEWTKGNVEFYARTCKVDRRTEPYHDGMQCDENSYEEVRLDIEGIVNGGQINRSVTKNGNYGDMKAVFSEDFLNYGKATFHLANEFGMNQVISIITEDLIFVKAEAGLGMTYSLGSATIDNVILTNKQSGNVSIFFGNMETTIRAVGEKVSKISKVIGGEEIEYNANGTATVTLPKLSKETTTKLTLEIELNDGTKITKNINVVRTAIELGFNRADGNATLEAGYVVNKAYLYNNKNHDDSIFNAYLQVILYKDGVVAGYKQIKIDDEKLVNNLGNNQSNSLELLSDNHINLYGKELDDTIEGVNSASVFLTNGPVDFNSDTLPSVEFGIGSGVTIDFGGEE